MRSAGIALALFCAGTTSSAETLVATRTISPKTVLAAADLTIVKGEVAGALREATAAIGLEARVALYPGRPIRADQLAPAAIVERNQHVALLYRQNGLTISAEGRALGRGANGDVIRVMNMASRTTVSGRIDANGRVVVGGRYAGN